MFFVHGDLSFLVGIVRSLPGHDTGKRWHCRHGGPWFPVALVLAKLGFMFLLDLNWLGFVSLLELYLFFMLGRMSSKAGLVSLGFPRRMGGGTQGNAEKTGVPAIDRGKAASLGSAMAVCTALAWTLECAVFSGVRVRQTDGGGQMTRLCKATDRRTDSASDEGGELRTKPVCPSACRERDRDCSGVAGLHWTYPHDRDRAIVAAAADAYAWRDGPTSEHGRRPVGDQGGGGNGSLGLCNVERMRLTMT
jgi:hypothetical protein